MIPQGIHRLNNQEYHDDPCEEPSLSRSTIKELLYDSPAHAWHNHPRLNPNFQADNGEGKFDIGTASHSLLLEGIENCAVIEADDWRKKEAKEARQKAWDDGKTPLLTNQYSRVLCMTLAAEKAIIACPELQIKDLRADGEAELSYIWQEGKTWFRSRPDWISKDRKLCLDYKTVGCSANPETIGRHIAEMGYDIQFALYRRGVMAIDNIMPNFVFVFQETEEPYLCSFVSLSPQFEELGKSKVDMGLFLWERCMTKNEWPAYPNRVTYPEVPIWSLTAWESIAERIGI